MYYPRLVLIEESKHPLIEFLGIHFFKISFNLPLKSKPLTDNEMKDFEKNCLLRWQRI